MILAREWLRQRRTDADRSDWRQNSTCGRPDAVKGAEMKQSGTRKLFNYWDKLRGERMAPEREDIDPAAIRGLLRDTFILEVDRGRTLPVRVAGARMSSLFLRELKAVPFSELFREEDRDSIRAIVESVIDDPTAAVVGLQAGPWERARLDLEMILLPLRHRGKTHARLLGAMTPATTPTWLGLLESAPLRLVSLRIIREEGFRDAAAPSVTAPSMEPPPAPRGRDFTLRVVRGGLAV
jgi:hypothetical protein